VDYYPQFDFAVVDRRTEAEVTSIAGLFWLRHMLPDQRVGLSLTPLSEVSCCASWEALLARFDLKSYARRGAEARLRELAEEAKQLLNVFPDLSASYDEDELRVKFILRKGARKTAASDSPVRRRRRKMTAAQRKAIGERMKRYWAARRKQTPKK
jgi:hypothetical protein